MGRCSPSPKLLQTAHEWLIESSGEICCRPAGLASGLVVDGRGRAEETVFRAELTILTADPATRAKSDQNERETTGLCGRSFPLLLPRPPWLAFLAMVWQASGGARLLVLRPLKRWGGAAAFGALFGLGACGNEGPGSLQPSSGGASSGAGSGGMASGGSPAGGASSGGAPSGGGGAGDGGTVVGAGGSVPAGGGGAGGAAMGGSPGAGGGGAFECTRDLLKRTLQNYLTALAARDPSTLPLSQELRFTENGEALEMGTEGLWVAAGITKYSQSAMDTELCTVAAHAVIPDGTTDIPVALRIRVENALITEVEMIAARPGDYAAVASNTSAIIAIADSVAWEESLPEGERASRDVLIAWMDKYFRKFPRGVCAVTSQCRRLENGGGNFPCGGVGATCDAGAPEPGEENLPPRLILADVETGVGVGFTIYDGHTDMHMFKMRGGSVSGVQAILSHSEGASGWD